MTARRVRTDLATLLAAVAGEIEAALEREAVRPRPPAAAGIELQPEIQVDEIGLTCPAVLEYERSGGVARLRVRLPSTYRARGAGRPGRLRLLWSGADVPAPAAPPGGHGR
jgi:hypothetical protein